MFFIAGNFSVAPCFVENTYEMTTIFDKGGRINHRPVLK